MKSAPPAPFVLPPGLPAGEATRPSASNATAQAANADTKYEEVALKTKEADKLTAPAYPTITNLMGWQSNLGVALVQASGVRNVEKVIFWISSVWAKGSKFEDFAESGGAEFVTLDIKLSMAMTSTIAHVTSICEGPQGRGQSQDGRMHERRKIA